MQTESDFRAYLVELLTTGDAAIPRLVALECADQIIETLHANPQVIQPNRPGERLRAALHYAGTHAPWMVEILGDHLSTAQAEKVLERTREPREYVGGKS